jgi:glycosyltransferase involved in cell wall biosynthesis
VEKKPRIYVAIATFYPIVGGAEKQALMQSRVLRERGYEATIITFRHEKNWLPREVMDGVPVIRVAGALLAGRARLPRSLQKLFYLVALVVMGWTLWRHRQRYDVLHVQQLNLLSLPAALACRLAHKPMVVVVQCTGPDTMVESSHTSLVAGPLDATALWLQVPGASRTGTDLEDLARTGKHGMRFTRSLLLRVHAVIVILSSRMKDYLTRYDFYLPGTQLIPNGVDSAHFRPAAADDSLAQGSQVVLCLARLTYQKGIDVLLQSWRLVYRKMPQVRLIIAGTGPLQGQLERMARELGIESGVEFAGLRSDVVTQLQHASIAVFPSRFEGMSHALLEAMAASLPCVATRVSGSEDLIQHGVNGLLVEPEDYLALAQALLDLLDDPALSRKYGYAARATVEKHYTLEHIMDTYIDLYHRVAEARWPTTEDQVFTEGAIAASAE